MEEHEAKLNLCQKDQSMVDRPCQLWWYKEKQLVDSRCFQASFQFFCWCDFEIGELEAEPCGHVWTWIHSGTPRSTSKVGTSSNKALCRRAVPVCIATFSSHFCLLSKPVYSWYILVIGTYKRPFFISKRYWPLLSVISSRLWFYCYCYRKSLILSHDLSCFVAVAHY